jgi:hypothetical protein
MTKNLYTAHNQWANRPADQRFQTLQALLAAVNHRRNLSRTEDVAIGKVEAAVHQIDGKDTIILNHGVKMVEPSNWSFGQLAATVKAPASYLRTLPPALAVDNLNHGIHRFAEEIGDRKFMSVLDEEGELNTLQALTSPTYGRIWDGDVVNKVMVMNENTGNKFFNPKAYTRDADGGFSGATEPSGLYASDRDVFIFMIDGGSLLDVGNQRAELSRGFIVSNSEVGSKTFSLTTFLFNHVCGNHIIWGAKDVKQLCIRHTSGGPDRFINEAAPALLNYVNSSAKEETEVIKRAQDFLIPVPEEAKVNTTALRKATIEWITAQGKFSKGEAAEAIDWANKDDGDCRTLWQIVQGFTASARCIEYLDARMDLETRAGKLLNLVSGN